MEEPMDTSKCCGAQRWLDTDICIECRDHADFIDDKHCCEECDHWDEYGYSDLKSPLRQSDKSGGQHNAKQTSKAPQKKKKIKEQRIIYSWTHFEASEKKEDKG